MSYQGSRGNWEVTARDQRERIALVLTATILPPPSVPNLTLRDPNARLQEYAKAIAWWAKSALPERVSVFVAENSGSADQLSTLESVRSGRVTVIGVEPGLADVALRGKGVGEACLLLEAAKVTREFDRVIKCTGRLTVRNWRDLLEDSQRYPKSGFVADWSLGLNRLDTRFFVVGPDQLEQLAKHALAHVDETHGVQLEDAVARWAVQSMADGGVCAMFSRSPVIAGRSASMGTSYHPIRAQVRSVLERGLRSRVVRWTFR